MIDVLLGEQTVSGTACPGQNATTRRMAITLYRSGEQIYGIHRWQEFLTLAANLFRTNNRWLPKTPVPMFYAAVEAMAQISTAADVRGDEPPASRLSPAPKQLAATSAEPQADSPNGAADSGADPSCPVLASCAQTVSVVHDEQSALTPERIADIATTFAASQPAGNL